MGRPEAVSNAEILEVARRLFLEQGATLSASEIAQALGVSHTTIFNRFGSKEQLMLAALAPLKETPWVAALESGPGPGSVRDQLVALADVHVHRIVDGRTHAAHEPDFRREHRSQRRDRGRCAIGVHLRRRAGASQPSSFYRGFHQAKCLRMLIEDFDCEAIWSGS